MMTDDNILFKSYYVTKAVYVLNNMPQISKKNSNEYWIKDKIIKK